VKHLGDRLTALVDDQLDHDDRDLALAHLARCPACQAAVEAERATASTLRGLPAVEPSGDLIQKLLALAEPGGPLPPDRRPFPGAAAPLAGWRPAGGRPASVPGPRRPKEPTALRRRTGVRLAVAGSLSVGALTMALASIGGADPTAPAAPPMQQFTVEHARSTGSLPFFDPAAVVVPAGVPASQAP
jgi:anti-sigma factor RsiW